MKLTALLRLALAAGFLLACNLLNGVLATPTALPSTPALATSVAEPLSVPAEYLSGVRLVLHDPLDNMNNWRTDPRTGALINGVFELQGSTFWHSNFSFKQAFQGGDGLIVTFRVQQADGQSEFVLVTGQWLTPSFRQFGLYNAARPRADLFQGRSDLGGYAVMGNLELQPTAWYALLLAVGHGGHMLAVMWDPSAPAQRAVYDLLGGPGWANSSWTFLPKANLGARLFVDDFYRITFTDIK